jgi:DNA-binding SARP family transcriptional activator
VAVTTDATTTPSAHLFLVGRFGCCVAGVDVRLAPTAERVLAFLALARRPVRRQQLAGTLWPDTTDRQALARLRSTLWKVPAATRDALVHADTTDVALHPGTAVDLYDLDGDGAPDGEGGAGEHLLLRGELLPGWDDDWVLVERERHRQLLLHLLEDRSAACCRRGRYSDALRFALEAVAREPLRESAHRRVVEAHLAEGNAAEALGQYGHFRKLLHTELGLAPSPAMRELVRPLLGRPAD